MVFHGPKPCRLIGPSRLSIGDRPNIPTLHRHKLSEHMPTFVCDNVLVAITRRYEREKSMTTLNCIVMLSEYDQSTDTYYIDVSANANSTNLNLLLNFNEHIFSVQDFEALHSEDNDGHALSFFEVLDIAHQVAREIAQRVDLPYFEAFAIDCQVAPL
jgi:hypothetical protein